MKEENELFRVIDEDVFLDNITYRMCRLLNNLKGNGLAVSSEKFYSLKVPEYDVKEISLKVQKRLDILNRVENLLDDRYTLPKHLIENDGGISVFTDRKIEIKEVENDVIIRMVESGDSYGEE